MTKGNRKRRHPKETTKTTVLSPLRKPKKLRARRLSPRPSSPQASASYLFIICLVVAIVAGGFVYHLHVRFEGVELGYETSKARAERARLLVERRELRLELASLKSAQRIETEAREKLGMDMPSHDKIVSIGKGKRTVLASGRAR